MADEMKTSVPAPRRVEVRTRRSVHHRAIAIVTEGHGPAAEVGVKADANISVGRKLQILRRED